MGWETSNRASRLPSNWQALRLRVLRRDRYSCQVKDQHGIKCNAVASEVDHVEAGDDHSMRNLRAICRTHHGQKTSAEGHAAWNAKRIPRRRPQETHPADL